MKEAPVPNGVPTAVTGQSLIPDALQSSNQKRYLDAVDHLRACGFEGELPLPQLVVCGDQSAGKSSVLEALTEIKFPRASGTCTRHATEIIMRHAATDSVTVSITPGPDRTEEQQTDLRDFHEVVESLETVSYDLGSLIKKAEEAMGINRDTDVPGGRSFSKDILRIEITGPSRPQFTVVDLPGIFSNESEDGEKELVYGLTRQFISQSRTICLAVIAASNDPDNQPILTEVKEADKSNIRTLGIITKPDLVVDDPGKQFWPKLAKNKHPKYFLKHGWHVLRNRKHDEEHYTSAERNDTERAWFANSCFKELPPDQLGIENLRIRLSHLLFQHIKRELPTIQNDIQHMTKSTRDALHALGSSRSSSDDARAHLRHVCDKIQNTCRDALTSNLGSKFFNSPSLTGFNSQSNWAVRRIRALVRKEDAEFAENIRVSGHALTIQDEAELAVEDRSFMNADDLDFIDADGSLPVVVTYREAITWVSIVREQCLGLELQGSFNPLIVGQLFWFQSKAWEGLAEQYIDSVSDICNDFMRQVLEEHCAEDVKNALWDQHVLDTLMNRRENAQTELKRILACYRLHPTSENAAYTEKMELRRRRRIDPNIKAIQDILSPNESQYELELSAKTIRRLMGYVTALSLTSKDPVSARWFSCEQALDCLLAIYEIKREDFIKDVLTQVIDMNLLQGLENVLSSTWASDLTAEQVERVAAEPEDMQRYREVLRARLAKLVNGQVLLKEALG